MKHSDSHAFVNQLLVYTLAMIVTSGSVGLGAVWLRYQIAATANHIKQTEARIDDCQRRLDETVTAIETEKSPDVLRHRDEELNLGLVEPKEMQVNRVEEDVESRLAAKHNRSLLTENGPALVVFNPDLAQPASATR